MDQRALGALAEELAGIAAEGTATAAARLGRRVREEAARHRIAPETLTNLVAAEWARLGIVPAERLITGQLQA